MDFLQSGCPGLARCDATSWALLSPGCSPGSHQDVPPQPSLACFPGSAEHGCAGGRPRRPLIAQCFVSPWPARPNETHCLVPRSSVLGTAQQSGDWGECIIQSLCLCFLFVPSTLKTPNKSRQQRNLREAGRCFLEGSEIKASQRRAHSDRVPRAGAAAALHGPAPPCLATARAVTRESRC